MGSGKHTAGTYRRRFLSQCQAVRKLVLPQPNRGGRMHFRAKMFVLMLAIAALSGLAGIPARAQNKDHVVSLSDLSKDTARPAQMRQSNEEAVRTLLSSDSGQKALKSAGVDYQK